ncbi:MAG: aromatic ring-hydroxylating dioxygenase subunit alpha [Pseudonocardiaceae bacterium]|nr:MAG: aromatic ring-hydroxylating dioxygenase subunit alpha [Pseudonocardiaceae bacterium]
MTSVSELRKIVDWQNGLVAPAVHFDEDLYRIEADRVFNHSWLVVGHEDMVRKPGDYVTNYMGEVPVIVVRDAGGQIRILVNRCAHRGNQVCLFDRGNVKGFTCSYHGWSYGLDGTLTGAPMEQMLYRGELDKAAWGLEEVANVANFKGLLLASLDPAAPALEEWLGEDVRWWLENFVLAGPLGGLETLPGWHRYRSPGNWKLVSENFIGDDYHVYSATHVSWLGIQQELMAEGVTIPIITYPGYAEPPMYEGSGGYGQGCPFGMGMVLADNDSMYNRDLAEAKELGPDAVEWVEHRQRKLLELVKDRDVKPYSFMNGLLFPNLGLMGFFSPMLGRHFQLFHPRGALEHECWQWTMVERDAPQVIKDLAVQRVYQGQHMAGLIAPDDVENFERMVEAGRPERNWKRPFHYGLQFGHEHEGPQGLPGNLGPNPSEVNQRQFYRFWLELMERS